MFNYMPHSGFTYHIPLKVYYEGFGEVTPGEYVELGQVGAFQYAFGLKSAFEKSGIASYQNPESLGYSPIPSNAANTFVANHDTERRGNTLNVDSPNNMYTLAHILMLAHPWGTPTVFSSYQFNNTDQGAPNGNYGTCSGNNGQGGWYCQHRWTPISGMVGFRNAVQTNGMKNWFSPTPQRVAFGRGGAGFVVINNLDQGWNSSFQTSLPAGKYCNVIDGIKKGGICSGTTVTVASNGQFTFDVGKRDAVAIHINAKL